MNNSTIKPGVSILVFAVLISSFLLVCTACWKTTSYLVDFTLQKQIYTQNRYFMEGIMRWAITWIKSEWDVLDNISHQQKKVTYSLHDWPKSIEHLKDCVPKLSIQNDIPDTRIIEVTLSGEQINILKAQCKLTRRVLQVADTTEFSFWVHDWHIGS